MLKSQKPFRAKYDGKKLVIKLSNIVCDYNKADSGAWAEANSEAIPQKHPKCIFVTSLLELL